MFGKKEIDNCIKSAIDKARDERITRLIDHVDKLEYKNIEFEKQIKQLNWKLDNPCPYKVGQKINGEIITEVYVHWQEHYCSFINPFKTGWHYKTVKPLK